MSEATVQRFLVHVLAMTWCHTMGVALWLTHMDCVGHMDCICIGAVGLCDVGFVLGCRQLGVRYQMKYHEKLHSVSVSSSLKEELQVNILHAACS